MTRARLLACCAPPVIVAVDFAVFSVVVPEMRGELALTDGQVRWIFTGYSLGFGAVLLMAGEWGDRWGRRRLLLGGLAAFAAGAVAVSAAGGAAAALAARVVQGVAAGIATPAALSLLTSGSRDGAERARATAAYGLAIAGGFVAGALASGILATLGTWRLATALTVPLCGAAAVAAWRIADDSSAARGAGRTPSLVTASALAGVVVLGAVSATSDGWRGILLPLVSIAAVLCFATRLGRASTGRARSVVTASAAGLVVTGTSVAATLLLTLFLQNARGLTAFEVGWVFACFGAAAVPGARLARLLATRGTPGSLIATGLGAQAAALVLVGAAAPEGGVLMACVAGFGMGHVIANASVVAVATSGAPAAVHGVLGGTLATAQYLGGALGPPLVARVAGPEALLRGIVVCGVAALAAAAAAWTVLRGVRWPAA